MTNTAWDHLYVESKKSFETMEMVKWLLPEAGGSGSMESLKKMIQRFSYKMSKVWGHNIYHGNYLIGNPVLYNWNFLRV